MGYDEPRFIGRNDAELSIAAQSGTFTASDHVVTSTAAQRLAMARACKLLGAAGVVSVAGTSKVPKFHILQSTNTAVTMAPSHTLGAAVVATVVGTRSFTAGEVLLCEVLHTGTASATQVAPVFDIILDMQDQFV